MKKLLLALAYLFTGDPRLMDEYMKERNSND